MWHVLCAMALLLGGLSQDAGSKKVVTQRDMEAQSQAEAERAEADLKREYSARLSRLSGHPRDLLETAEQAFEVYRLANCRASAAAFSGGSMESLEANACYAKMTRERIAEIMRIYGPGRPPGSP